MTRPLLLLLLLAPCAARAQLIEREAGPVKLSLSGYVSLRAASRHNLFHDGRRTRFSGEHQETFLDPRLELVLRADHTGDWFGSKLRLVSRHFPDVPPLLAERDDYPRAGRPTAALEIWPQEAYLETGAKTHPFYLRAGLQHLRYALRQDGGSFLLDIPQGESPFDRAPIWAGAGGRATWTREIYNQPLSLDLFYLQLLGKDLDARDEAVFGVNLDWLVAGPEKRLQNLFNLILADINRGGRHSLTAGGGVDWHLSVFWELFAEFYGQTGDRSDLAGRAGVRHTWFNLRSEPWVELGAAYASRDFKSYENVDTFKILEDDDLGLDVDRNYWSLRVRAGLDLKPALARDVRLELRYGWFRQADRTRGLPAQLGHEVDLELRWLVNKSLTLGAGAAALLGSEHFAARSPRAGREHGMLIYLEAELRF